jgi:hypothetical protein
VGEPEKCTHHEWVERTAQANVVAIGEIRQSLKEGTLVIESLKKDVGAAKRLLWVLVVAIMGMIVNSASNRLWPLPVAAVAPTVAWAAAEERAAAGLAQQHADAERAHADAVKAAQVLQVSGSKGKDATP